MVEQDHLHTRILAPGLQGRDHNLAHIGGQGMQGVRTV
jgi:hypothetical protein